MTAPVEVREHHTTELPALIAVASRAFWDDPLFNFFAPDLLVQHRWMSGFFAAGIHDCARHGSVWTASIGDTVVGVAAWLPPGVHVATSGIRALRQMRHALPTIARSPERVRAVKLMNEMPRRHLTDPHWYLELLAADPKFQGRGVGRALLQPILQRCDLEGYPAYLETQKEDNLAYYARLGFAVTDVIDLGKTPRVWTMTRPAVP